VEPHTRRAVAYIAGRLISGSGAGAVYDYSETRYVYFSGDVSDDAVNVYDYEQRCHIAGSPPSLFHFRDRRHIEFDRNGQQVNGFDYATNQHFSGTVNGNAVSLFDYEDNQNYNYSL
jgi:hypothetical protein